MKFRTLIIYWSGDLLTCLSSLVTSPAVTRLVFVVVLLFAVK